jgi:hypothetical protein
VATATAATSIDNDKIILTVKNRNIIINAPGFQEDTYSYELYNLAGQLLLNNPITSSNVYVSLDTEPTGMYVMNIKSREGKTITRKLFVE